VHDDGDDREEQQDVDEETGDMQAKEEAKPHDHENNCEDEEHFLPSFFSNFMGSKIVPVRRGAGSFNGIGEVRAKNRCLEAKNK
jgi:hypothetical protein